MPRSLLDQLVQIRGSNAYDDAVPSANTLGVAEGQLSLEGDLNVLRTLNTRLKDNGVKPWYQDPDMTLDGLARKYVRAASQQAGFVDVPSGTGTSSPAFDAAIKLIPTHNDGGGNSTTEGVIVNATFNHKLIIREHDTQNAINDGSGNDVYARLSWSSTPVESGDNNNQLSGYASITGVTAANTDAEKALHFSIVDDGGGFFHIDIYKDLARTLLVGHTATYNSTGGKTVLPDNASGLGGTVTVDAVTAVDVDIKVIFGRYILSWFSWIAGVETAYSFVGSVDIDLIEVLVSRQWQNFPWDSPYHPSFHDASGFTGSVDDDNVVTNGFTDLLVGLVTQAQVNARVDDLGSSAAGQGASLIKIEDAGSYYAGVSVEAALAELDAQIGGLTSSTFGFSENNVLADNDFIYPALEKLDLKWGDLASVANGEGASLVGVEDAGGFFTGTDVEAVLAELYGMFQDVAITKHVRVGGAAITAGTPVTITGGGTYTPASGANMDVFVNGQLMVFGATEDYTEPNSTQTTFTFTIPAGSNITWIIRK